MRLIILLLFMVIAGSVHAQDITTQNISWQIARMDNRTTGELDERGGTIKSYNTNRVEWYDDHGVLVQTFAIHEIDGSWSNVAVNGFILYEANSGGNPVTITLSRDSGILRITIAVLQSDDFPLIREFTIQNFTTL